jgi:hypothetical protein
VSQPPSIKKHPTELLNISFDYAARLAAGEAISSAVASLQGAATIVLGTVVVVPPNIVIVPVSAGTDGQTDAFVVDATTNGVEILAAVVKMAVSLTDF